MRTILLCAMLTGCATGPTVPTVVRVPVPTPCLSAPPPAIPATTPEAEILAMSDYAATLLTWTERLELRAWAEKAEAMLIACQ